MEKKSTTRQGEPSEQAQSAQLDSSSGAHSELEEALAAREADPGQPAIEFRLALLLHAKGESSKALEAFGDCARSSMELGQETYKDAARLGSAACWLEMSNPGKAIECLEGVDSASKLWLGYTADAQTILSKARAMLENEQSAKR